MVNGLRGWVGNLVRHRLPGLLLPPSWRPMGLPPRFPRLHHVLPLPRRSLRAGDAVCVWTSLQISNIVVKTG